MGVVLMASTATALLLSVIAGVLAISATARPCKTIFFITSSSSSSIYPTTDHYLPNPNSPRFTFFITEIHQFHRTRSFSRPIFTDRAVKSSSDDAAFTKPYHSSFGDRTMDFMSFVGALLFGAGCGALTIATMYLFRSLFSNRRLDFASDSDEEDDLNPKNNGYAVVPSATKDIPPSADEVDAMKG